MLRISTIERGNRHATLQLEGRVAGPWVAELSSACDKHLDEGRALELDLAGVSFLDPDGIALVSGLKGRGVVLVGCSPFVGEQLKLGAEHA